MVRRTAPARAPAGPPSRMNGTQEHSALEGLTEPPTAPEADVTVRVRGTLAAVSRAMQEITRPDLYVTLAPSDNRM